MATESWVVKLSRVDQDNQPILVHVSRKPGGQTLDLDLLATDGESAYRGKSMRLCTIDEPSCSTTDLCSTRKKG